MRLELESRQTLACRFVDRRQNQFWQRPLELRRFADPKLGDHHSEPGLKPQGGDHAALQFLHEKVLRPVRTAGRSNRLPSRKRANAMISEWRIWLPLAFFVSAGCSTWRAHADLKAPQPAAAYAEAASGAWQDLQYFV